MDVRLTCVMICTGQPAFTKAYTLQYNNLDYCLHKQLSRSFDRRHSAIASYKLVCLNRSLLHGGERK